MEFNRCVSQYLGFALYEMVIAICSRDNQLSQGAEVCKDPFSEVVRPAFITKTAIIWFEATIL